MMLDILLATIVYASTKPPAVVGGGYHSDSMVGYEPSAYTGKYYHRSGGKKSEAYRKCVLVRESEAHYGAKPKFASAAGGYQWLKPWYHALPHMIYPELRQMYGKKEAKRIRTTLLRVGIPHYSRFYQDMAFYTVLSWDHKFSGAKHWYGGRWTCTPGMKHWSR